MELTEYETVYVLKPDLAQEKLDRVRDRVLKVIADNKSEVIHQKDWGKKKLAYRIDKSQFGHYFYFNYAGGGQFISELERILKYEEDIIRYLTVKLGKISHVDQALNSKKATLPEEAKLKVDDSKPFRDYSREPREPRDFSKDGDKEVKKEIKGEKDATEI